MPDFNQLCIDALHGAKWLCVDNHSQLGSYQKNWLLEFDSMTARLRSHCISLHVDLIKQYDIASSQLTFKEKMRLGCQACLVREVLLCGDNRPWLIARSLIPYSTISDTEQDMADLGSIPLGDRVFSVANSFRDEIEMAFIDINHQILLARRSRLWINEKPLLVAEIFLPLAPIYTQGDLNGSDQS